MKTRDAFAFRDFDANKFISHALDAYGLNLTPEKLLGTAIYFEQGDLIAQGIGQAGLSALGVDTADINSLQDARRKFFALQTRLDDFIRRIIRHQQRLKNFSMYTNNPQHSAIFFTKYTQIINSVLSYTYAIKGTIDNIDTLQRCYVEETFATRLRQARKAAGLRQSDLGARIGLTGSAIGAYEQGRNEPDLALLAMISKELGKTVDWFLGIEP